MLQLFFANAEYINPLGDKAKTLFDIVDNVANAAIALSIPLAVIAIIVIGIQFVMASGNPSKITEMKKKFFWVLIGAALMAGSAMLAKTIVDFIQHPNGRPVAELPEQERVFDPQDFQENPPEPEFQPPPSFAHELFDDTTFTVSAERDEIIFTDVERQKTTTFQYEEGGSGIAFVRERYPNVIILGGEISMTDARALRESLDKAYARLPETYRNPERTIVVPVDPTFAEDLHVAQGGAREKTFNNDGYNTAGGLIVLNAFAAAQKENTPVDAKGLPYTIVHELAHTSDRWICDQGCTSQDLEWQKFHRISKSHNAVVSKYARTDSAEDWAETVTAAAFDRDRGKIYTGNTDADEILKLKYMYLLEKGAITHVPIQAPSTPQW